MPQIVIEIDAQGQVQLEVSGCPGPSCKALTSELEAALGETVQDSPTREMSQMVRTSTRRKVSR